MTRTRVLTLLIAATAAVTLVAAWGVFTDAWPWIRGYGRWPPGWRWLHVPLGWERPLRLLGHGGLLLAYGVAVALLTAPSRLRRARWGLTAATAFLFGWQLAQTWVREQSLLDTMVFRTYAPPLNGYFLAPAQVQSIRWTLLHYVEAMPTFFSDKPQTHPPGLFLFYALFQELLERLPGLTGWFAPMARSWALPGRDWPHLPDALVTSAFVTSLIQTGLTALTPLGAYFFVGGLRLPTEAIRRDLALGFALMVPLIPPLTLFYLQWDTLYPGLGLLAWGLALRGQNRLWDLHYRGWGQWLDWLWAGLWLSLLSWLSYGNLVFGLMVGLHLLWREGMVWREARARLEPLWILPLLGGMALMALGVALPWLLAYMVWGMDPFAIMRQALATHYALVTVHREYGVWLWMNLVDFALWLGPAPALLGVAGSLALWHRAPRARGWRDLAGLAGIFWLVLAFLDLSGVTRGEIGRLWAFLMPFPLLFALALPWRAWHRWTLLGLLALWNGVLAYSLAPFQCC